MATYGQIKEFDDAKEEWSQYVERLGHYFLSNDIDDADKRKAIFLSVCGRKIYKLMCDLLSPAKPGDKSFQELSDLVRNHLQPKPSEIVQRYKFHSCFRQADQSVSDHVAHLRNLSTDCNFGATLEPMLRDRLVCGVNNDRIQRRLLSERDLNYKKALELAQGMEQAEKSAADLQKNERSHVNSVKQSGFKSKVIKNSLNQKNAGDVGARTTHPMTVSLRIQNATNVRKRVI